MHKRLRCRRRAHAANWRMLASRDALLQSLCIVQHALGVFERDLSGLRELDAALGAYEERLAQLSFGRLDLMTDRRLREIETLRRARASQGLGQNTERA